MSQNRLVLASASPRRAQLLRQINLNFDVLKPDIDETPFGYGGVIEAPADYVARMSAGKAEAAMALLGELISPGLVILCADTIVVADVGTRPSGAHFSNPVPTHRGSPSRLSGSYASDLSSC
jgi:predicted house-cleaning NTP pyrophosphatase (Maf/HAM1 superfamily)